MIAEYKGNKYYANMLDESVVLLTYNRDKAQDGFKPNRDYFSKTVDINEPLLSAVYEIHFFVKYKDSIETKDFWIVDEDRAVGLKGDIEKGEVVIDVSHDAKDESWIQYEKGAAAKKISLNDCTDIMVEKKYFKKDGKLLDEIMEIEPASVDIFMEKMIENRRSNL